MPEIEIHLVTAANASVLERVNEDVFDHPVQPELLRAFLSNPSNQLVVAVAEQEVVGMASGIAYVHPDKPLQLFINEVGVAEPYQRRGVGKRLLGALLQRGRELGCNEAWVATEVGNTAARSLYASLGGKLDSEQAVVFQYPIGQDQGAKQEDDSTH